MVSILKWQNVVGPPLIEGRGVFVVFWSFCIGFYSILCCSRRAYSPFFKLFSPISLFFFVQQPLAEPSLQEDTWSGFFFTPSTKVFFSSQGSLNCWVKKSDMLLTTDLFSNISGCGQSFSPMETWHGGPQPNRWISPSKAYVISKKFSWSQGKR